MIDDQQDLPDSGAGPNMPLGIRDFTYADLYKPARMTDLSREFDRFVQQQEPSVFAEFYRKGMKDAPSYKQNHEEVIKALEEGIAWAEGMNPKEAIPDKYGHIDSVTFEKMALEDGKWTRSGSEVSVPMRSLYVAAGTSPNTIYESEYPGTFAMDHKFFQRFEPEWGNAEPELKPVADTLWPKIGKPAPLTSYEKNGKHISFYGDNHPVYAGNVVKAMASAKDGYPYVCRLFENELKGLEPDNQKQRDQQWSQVIDKDTEITEKSLWF